MWYLGTCPLFGYSGFLGRLIPVPVELRTQQRETSKPVLTQVLRLTKGQHRIKVSAGDVDVRLLAGSSVTVTREDG